MRIITSTKVYNLIEHSYQIGFEVAVLFIEDYFNLRKYFHHFVLTLHTFVVTHLTKFKFIPSISSDDCAGLHLLNYGLCNVMLTKYLSHVSRSERKVLSNN